MPLLPQIFSGGTPPFKGWKPAEVRRVRRKAIFFLPTKMIRHRLEGFHSHDLCVTDRIVTEGAGAYAGPYGRSDPDVPAPTGRPVGTIGVQPNATLVEGARAGGSVLVPPALASQLCETQGYAHPEHVTPLFNRRLLKMLALNKQQM